MTARLQRLTVCLVVLAACTVRAVTVTPTFTWSTGTPTPAFELAGNWVSEGSTAPTTGGILIFGPSGTTSVVLAANFSAESITFNSTFPSYVFSSNNNSALNLNAGGLTVGSLGSSLVSFQSSMQVGLAANQTWHVESGRLLNMAAHVYEAGSGSRLTKTGTGTLVLSNGNAYSGGTTISAGVVSIASESNLGFNPATPTPGNVTFNGGTLATTANLNLGANRGIEIGAGGGAITVDTSTQLTINGIIAGSGPFTKGGHGTLVLLATNTYTGATSLTAGITKIATDAALGTAPASATASHLTLSNANLWATDSFTLNSNRGLSLAGAPSFNVDSGRTLTYGGIVAGAGDLLLNSGGTLALGGANTYSGATFIYGGTLKASNAASLGGTSAGTTVSSGGALLVDGVAIGSEAITLNGNGPSGGGALVGAGSASLAGNITLASNATIGAPTSDDFLTLSGTMTESGGARTLTKAGSGTVILTGTASHSGGTTVSGGSLQIGSGGTSGSIAGNVTVTGGNLAFNRSDDVTYSGNVSGAGILKQLGTGRLTLTGSNFNNGGLFIATGGTLSVGNGGANGSISGNVTNDGTLIFDRTGNVSFNGVISGSGGLIKRGAGTLTLNSSASSFSGPVNIEAGVLAVSSLYWIDYDSSLGTGTVGTGTIAIGQGTTGATLRYTGGNGTSTDRPIDLAGTTGGATLDVTGSGSVYFYGNIGSTGAGTKTLTLSGNSGSGGGSSISGIISDNSSTHTTSLLKTGFGTWRLAGVNTYTGGTTVVGGRLVLDAENALPSGGHVTINGTSGSAILDLESTAQTIGSLTFGGPGAGAFTSNAVVLGYSGSLTLGGNLIYDATNNPSGATIARGNIFYGEYPFDGTLNLGGATRTFALADSSNATTELSIYSNITNGGITQTGAGSLLLAGDSSYAGGTTVTTGSGPLLLASSSSLDGSSIYAGPIGLGALTMQAGTTLAPAGVHVSYYNYNDDILVHNAVSLGNNVTLGLDGMDNLAFELAGPVQISSAASTLHLGGNEPVQFSGFFGGANAGTALTIDSGGRAERGVAIFTGAVGSNLSSLTADRAGLVFGSPGSLDHSAAIKVTNQGYVGVGVGSEESVPTAAALLARIAPADQTAFAGTFGFDTDDNLYEPHTFAEALNFSGFGSGFTIGSLSGAILTGAITPPAGGYTFGNGGGTLVVRSNLADVGGSTAVSVNSVATIPENALTVIFQGNNTFSGNLNVTNSLAILDSATALPAGRTFSLGANGYLGFTEALTSAPTFASLLTRLSSYQSSSVLGIDSSDFIADQLTNGGGYGYYNSRIVTDPIDLSALGRVYLGSATNVALAGRIQAPNQSGADRTLSLLAAYDGRLSVPAPLAAGDVNRVEVGSESPVLGEGRVELRGHNTYMGGTTLLSGHLGLADNTRLRSDGTIISGPIGTGTLTVPSTAVKPVLSSAGYDVEDLVLHNPISLGSRLQLGFVDFEEFNNVAGFNGLQSEGYYGYSRVTLNGAIANQGSNVGSLDVFSDTTLNASNTFTGGVTLNYGRLTIGHDAALGTGTLTLNPRYYDYYEGAYVSLGVGNGSRTIANNVVINAFAEDYLPIYGHGSLTINGTIQLNSSVTFSTNSGPLLLNGNITGSGRLAVYGDQSVILSGTNSYNGGTTAEYGNIIFANGGSLPGSSSLASYYYGYIGIGFVPGSIQNDFLNRFNKGSTSGAIGFDGPLTGTPNTFTGTINLGDPDTTGPATAFSTDVRLGSATRAILSAAATITPQDDYYRFGGGGGLLEVNSNLVDGANPRSLIVDSQEMTPLTLRLGGTNTYSGSDGTRVDGSAVIFQSGSMPATGTFQLSDMGYIGTEDAGPTGAQALINRFSSYSHRGTIGFDSFTGTYAVGGTLDLSALDPGATVFLGTATSATIGATGITLPVGQTAYRFAGYKGGQLTVTTPLGGANSVVIGDRNTAAMHRSPADFTGPLSSVTLSGNNTYTGGTTLYSGQLMFGSNAALGTGTLTVDGGNFYDYGYEANFGAPVLAAAASGLSLPNNLYLYSDLTLGGSNGFTLAGAISGYGEIYKTGNFTVTLSGDNSAFSGGFYIAQGSINVAHANALGTGPLGFGTVSGPSVAFSVDATVNGISGDNSLDLITVGSGNTLTINQGSDSQYLGHFASSDGALVFQGYGRLRLGGDSSGYTGTTLVGSGVTLQAGNNNAFGPATNVVTVRGGTLAVESGVTIANVVTLQDGALAGTGTFKPAATLQVGRDGEYQGKLAPGFSAGTLHFDGSLLGVSHTLSLAAGGAYLWEFQDAANSAAGWDQIAVAGNVNISATTIAPFDFKIVSLGADGDLGLTLNFDPTKPGQWTVLTATNITGFTGSGQFAIQTNMFQNSIAGVAGFNFSLAGSTGNMALMLNFDPTIVPEPSTYVLLALGLFGVVFVLRRRRC